jgi:hypothetical protein
MASIFKKWFRVQGLKFRGSRVCGLEAGEGFRG